MPYLYLIQGNMKILRRFQADLTQNGLRNPSGIVAELKRNSNGILAESIYAYPFLIPGNMKFSRRFHPDFIVTSGRTGREIGTKS